MMTSPRDDAVTTVLGALLVGGVLADAWAHSNIVDTIESFFTPWHALLYAGFAGAAAWTFALAYRRRASVPLWWRDGWPPGYRLGALGVLIFLAGGFGDMLWHGAFGIESGLDGALSPSHVTVVVGGVLLLTSPMRSWLSAADPDPRRAASGVVSMALGTTMAATLLLDFLAVKTVTPTEPYRASSRAPEYVDNVSAVQGYLLGTVLLVIPLLLAHRRRATPGAATVMVGMLFGFVMVMYQFPSPATAAGLAAIAGAAALDVLLVKIDTVRGPRALLRLPLAGALVGLTVWPAHLLGLHLAGGGIRWSPEAWTGTIVLTALLGALLGTLAARAAPADVEVRPTASTSV